MDIHLDNDSVSATSGNIEILRLNDFPVAKLRYQLKQWLESTTEESPKSFAFESVLSEEQGIFRIEPRPNGWQFTSHKELQRSNELLPLGEWRKIIKCVI